MQELRTVYLRCGIPALIILIFVVSIFIRIYRPYADPPVDLDNSGGLFFDEGGYAHNARNKIVYGEWRMDRFNSMLYSPISSYLIYISFKIFGIGLLQERLVPLILSILLLILFYKVMLNNYDIRTAIVGLLVMGLNFRFAMFNRIGLLENYLAFAYILTLFLFQKGINRNSFYLYLAGLSSILAFIFKNFAIYFIMTTILTIILNRIQKDRFNLKFMLKDLIIFGSGIMTLLIPWLFIFYYPNIKEIAAIGDLQIAQSLPGNISRLWSNILNQPFLLYLSDYPVIIMAGLGFSFYIFYSLISRKDNINVVDLLSTLWLLGGIAFFAIFNYRPVRYYIPLVPLICLLASRAIVMILENKERLFSNIRVIGFSIMALFYFMIILYLGIPKYKSLYLNFLKSLKDIMAFSLLVSIMLCVVSMILIYIYKKLARARSFIAPAIITILLIINSASDIRNYYRYLRGLDYKIYEISKEIGRNLERAFISGLATPALVLENDHRALYAGRRGWFDGHDDIFQRYPGISHVFAAVYNSEVDWYFKTFPEIMLKAELIKVYNIWKSEFYFFSLGNGREKMLFYENPSNEYDALVVKSSFPSFMKVNEKHEVWIEIKNTGKNSWLKKDEIKLGAINDSDHFTFSRHLLADNEVITPGQTKIFYFELQAPSRAGIYATDWRMVKENSFWFGEPFLKAIQVRSE